MELTSLVDQVMEMYTCGRYLSQIRCLLACFLTLYIIITFTSMLVHWHRWINLKVLL
jgi:hypothetical protein